MNVLHVQNLSKNKTTHVDDPMGTSEGHGEDWVVQ